MGEQKEEGHKHTFLPLCDHWLLHPWLAVLVPASAGFQMQVKAKLRENKGDRKQTKGEHGRSEKGIAGAGGWKQGKKGPKYTYGQGHSRSLFLLKSSWATLKLKMIVSSVILNRNLGCQCHCCLRSLQYLGQNFRNDWMKFSNKRLKVEARCSSVPFPHAEPTRKLNLPSILLLLNWHYMTQIWPLTYEHAEKNTHHFLV